MISKFFIEHPVLANVLAIVLIVIGAVSIYRLPVSEYPNVVPPTVQVTTSYPGASAEIIESQVTTPLEVSLAGIEGIKTIKSVSREEVSQITVELVLERNVDAAAHAVETSSETDRPDARILLFSAVMSCAPINL